MTAYTLLTTLSLAAAVTLTACGGGDGAMPLAPSPAKLAAPTSLHVIGNSITYIAQSADWPRSSGMAASSVATDYAHLVAAGMGITEPVIGNYATLEANSSDPINTLSPESMAALVGQASAGVDAHSAVVVELGDNALAGGSAAFAANYGRLLDAVAGAQVLVCVGTYWFDAGKENIIKTVCAAHGGRYVYVGDIYTRPGNTDFTTGVQYANPAINRHPHDGSMAIIASRVLTGLAG